METSDYNSPYDIITIEASKKNKGTRFFHVFNICRCCGSLYGLMIKPMNEKIIAADIGCHGDSIINRCSERCKKRCETLLSYLSLNQQEAEYSISVLVKYLKKNNQIHYQIEKMGQTDEVIIEKLLELQKTKKMGLQLKYYEDDQPYLEIQQYNDRVQSNTKMLSTVLQTLRKFKEEGRKDKSKGFE
jgi:hypothetical protein